MIRNIIFDWSGTLVDDLSAVWQATNYIFQQVGIAHLTLEQFREEFTLPFDNFYKRYTPHISPKQLEEWFHHSYRQGREEVVELPHAREFLEFCRQRELALFALSAVTEDHFLAQARRIGFERYFDRLYLGAWDKRERIGGLLKENKLDPAETLFVGDMQHDIDAARHGRVRSCAVLTGYNSLEQLRASEPDLIVEHLGELQSLLERNAFEWPTDHLRHPRAPQHPVVTVGALIFNDQGQVLMIQTHKWSDLWGIPGGKIRFGEPSEEALHRELLEETNLQVTDIRFVMVQDCIGSKEFYREAHFVLLNYTCRCVGEPVVRLNEEAQTYQWLEAEKALALPLNNPTRVLLEKVTLKSLRDSKDPPREV